MPKKTWKKIEKPGKIFEKVSGNPVFSKINQKMCKTVRNKENLEKV